MLQKVCQPGIIVRMGRYARVSVPDVGFPNAVFLTGLTGFFIRP